MALRTEILYVMLAEKMNKTAFCVLLLTLCAFLYPSQEEAKVASALRIEEPIVVDGFLSESIWGEALPIGNFIQFEPDNGQLASFETTVRILYDDDYLYVGYTCFDPEPEKIAARITKRDGSLSYDDVVSVWLDTFHDKRSCYVFATNLLGTQVDGRIIDNGKVTDMTWDGIWKSAAQRTESGWSAEIAIDLSSLKYRPGRSRTWGFNVGRIIPRSLELCYWAGPLESPYRVSQHGDLKGLDLEKAGKKSQIIPHIIGRVEEKKQSEIEAGLDLRYAFSQMLSGHLTANPDFATVEADQEQINLTRFELHLPEKRNFFLEGSEIYEQRIRLFYSRRIGNIYGGLRVYGKSGPYELSGMSVQTKEDESTGESSANFTVFRLKRDVMRSSTIGFLAANTWVDGKNRGTTGLDTALYFSNTFRFTGQLAVSYGDYGRDNIAFFLRPSYDSATFHFHLRYTHLGKHFGDNANHVGFISDDNRRELDSAITKTFWLKKGSVERIGYESNYNIYWGMDGTLRSWKIDQELNADFKNKFTLEAEHTQEYKLYEKEFRNNSTSLMVGYNTREWQSASLTYSFGRNFDSDFSLYEGQLNYKITKGLSLEYAITRLTLNPDPLEEGTWIHVLRTTHYFNKDLFLKVFYQVNSAIDKKNIQVLFVYRFQPPFGLIQLAYQKGTAGFGERGTQGHTLFLKIALMF
jgi:hypothetical protein